MSTTLQPPTMQDLYLEILRRSECNNLNGQRVHDDLLAHRDLWQSAYPIRESGEQSVTLRDLADDSHDVDTLYLRTTKEHEAALSRLARAWKADEFDLEQDKYGRDGVFIARIWWD